jgi:S1-C subfamily serine protease
MKLLFLLFLLFSCLISFSQAPTSPTPTSEVPKPIYTFSQIKDNFSKYVVYVQSKGQATGIILNKHFVLINNHSVPDSKAVLLILWDGDDNLYNNPKFIGNVITQDETNDLALLYVNEELPDLPDLALYKESLSSLSTKEVFSIGNPNGWDRSWSYSKGYVSKSPANCELENVKFTGLTLSIDSVGGSSGSLILSENGEWIGMICMGLPGTRFTDVIPAEIIKNFMGKSLAMMIQMAKQKENKEQGVAQ